MKKIIKQEQWVMLSTEDKTQIIVPTRGVGKGVLHNKEYYGSAMLDMGDEYQHLYLTSSDEIKEGDWMFIDEKGTKRNPGRGYVLTQHKGNPASKLNAICGGTVKIIATTDKFLKIPINKHLIRLEEADERDETFLLPQIPESFIKYYIEKQGKVGDVEMEYRMLNLDELRERGGGFLYCDNSIAKLTDNNEIIIDMPKEENPKETHNMAACLLSIYDSLKLEDNNSRDTSESLTEVMFRKMKAYDIDLNNLLGFTHLKPIEAKKVMTDIVTEKIEEVFIKELIKRGTDTNSYLPKVEEKMYSRDAMQKAFEYGHMTAKSVSDFDNWIKENL